MKRLKCFIVTFMFLMTLGGGALSVQAAVAVNETEQTSIDYMSYDTNLSYGVNYVLDSTNGNRLEIPEGANAVYQLSVSRAGWYKLMTYNGKWADNTERALIGNVTTVSGAVTPFAVQTNNLSAFYRYTIGRFYLETGVNLLTFTGTATSGTMLSNPIFVKCVDLNIPINGVTTIEVIDYWQSNITNYFTEDAHANDPGSYGGETVAVGSVLAESTGTERTLTYHLNAAVDGDYILKLYTAFPISDDSAIGKQKKATVTVSEENGILSGPFSYTGDTIQSNDWFNCSEIELEPFHMAAGSRNITISVLSGNQNQYVALYAFRLERVKRTGIASVVLTDEIGEELHTFAGIQELNATVTVIDLEKYTSPISSILALYDNTGKLLRSSVQSMEICEGVATANNTISTEGLGDKLKTCQARIYIWNNLTNLQPIATSVCNVKTIREGDFYTVDYVPEGLLNATTVRKENFVLYDITAQEVLDITEVYYVPTDNVVTLKLTDGEKVSGLCEIRPQAGLLLCNGSVATRTYSSYATPENNCELNIMTLQSVELYSGSERVRSPYGSENLRAVLTVTNAGAVRETVNIAVLCNHALLTEVKDVTIEADETKQISVTLPEREYRQQDVIVAKLKK